MLEALLHGKLSSNQENMEDLLTSCVFGAFKYLDYEGGLGAFLQQATGINTSDRPFADLRIQSATFEFWPFWSEKGYENCEPDVVISVTDAMGTKLLIAVEVKYRSGKSGLSSDDSDAPTDQLAKEWDHLTRIAMHKGYKPRLVYVTTDAVMPRNDIEQAGIEYSAKRGSADETSPFRCSWISWRCLFRLMGSANNDLAVELRDLAGRFGFREFDGFSDLHAVCAPVWRYSRKYEWGDYADNELRWRYRDEQ